MPGVGKTAVAVHLAHLVKDRFPDRQLQLNLHGHTPDQEPTTPFEALGVLLTAVGMDARYLPATLDERVGHWRDRMKKQRALLVLDNARDSRQVRPLLTESPTCLVLVTSRHHLGELKSGIYPIALDVLSEPEARELFIRLAPRAAAEPVTAVHRIVILAGRLPLAIALLTELYASSGDTPLTAMIEDVKGRLLTVTSETTTLAVVFDLSFDALQEPQQQFFVHLGLHPGTEIDTYPAAALTEVPVPGAAGLLQSLYQARLLIRTKATWGRYGMHDLIRTYIQDRAATMPAEDREQALDRLLDYYQHTATRAEGRLARQTRPGPPPATPPEPAAAPELDDAGQALAWARAERANLLACIDHATGTGQRARVVALTAALAGLLRRDGPWADAITRHTTAIEAAQRLGDRLGQANALSDLGAVRRLTDDYPAAAQDLEQALGIYRDLGNRLGQANALSDLGAVQRLTDDYPAAAQDLEQALGICRDLGNRSGEAEALNERGTLHRLSGELARAERCHQQALELAHAIASSWDEAHALVGLGRCAMAVGNAAQAKAVLRQALEISSGSAQPRSQPYSPN
jgi:tetratricopeptide (TPR) repeat protein